MSFFGRENFNHFRERFLDKDAVSRMFEGFRNRLIARGATADEMLRQHPNDPEWRAMILRHKADVNHQSLIFEIMEATMINLINLNETVNRMIEANMQEGDQRMAEFADIKKEVDSQKQALADLKKHQTNLEWIDKFFKSESSRADK